MSRIRHTSALAGLFLLMGSSLGPMAGHAQCRPDQRRITVADTVEMTELSSPEPDAGADPDAIASYSPDGRHFAVIVKKGNLRDNTNRFTLLVFATRSALAHPAPEASVTLASNSNRSAIADLRWLADGHTLLFLGEEPNAEAQIYSFDLASRHLRRLTAQPTSVVRYDASEDSHVIVFETEPAPEDIVDTSGTRRSGFVLHGEELSTVLFSGYHSEQSMAFRPRQLFVMRGEEKPRRVAAQDGIWPFLNLSVSPDGRYALLGALMLHVPPEWMLYKERALHQVVAARRQPRAISEVESYVLLDTRTAMLTSLLDAPKDWPNDGYLWLDRGHTLVVSHAYLPLAGVADPQRTLRASRARVVAVNLPSRTFTPIGGDDLTASSWNAARNQITLVGRGRQAPGRQIYRRRGDGWQEVPVPSESVQETRPAVTLVQDLNAAPALWLFDPVAGRRVRLLDLNPQFAGLCFGREEEITWKTTDGREVRGGLYLPPDYTPGRRYPLVIQTHLFVPHEFWIDGPWHGAYAAQPLAAKDIVVLQMGYDHVVQYTPEEAPRAMAAIDGAIDALDAKGIIDPNLVGIIGFSRTVYHVAYTLTHSRHRFAAATLADGFDGDYFQTIAFPATEGSGAAAVNGGPPYGPSLSKWLEHSPLFNIASVTSPIRLEGYGMDSVLNLWGWYSLLTQMARPVDMIVFPHAPHLLVKPWERMASQQGDVDWFCLWLRGEKDPTPEKAAEYVRWEALRSLLENADAQSQSAKGQPKKPTAEE